MNLRLLRSNPSSFHNLCITDYITLHFISISVLSHTMIAIKLISLLTLATSAQCLVHIPSPRTATSLRNVFSASSCEGDCTSVSGGVNHRHSANDWLHNVQSLPHSSVLRDIRNPVVTIAVWSTFVSIVHNVMAGSASTTARQMATNMCIGATPHSFLVSSLGLLLFFRTNSAYQRFSVRFHRRD